MPNDEHGAGSPSKDTIVRQETFTPGRVAKPGDAAAPQAARRTYQILVTSQTDPYDRPAPPTEEAARPPEGDNFVGKDRKVAKLSIPEAATEDFTDVKELVPSLVPDDDMINHSPKITEDPTSVRTTEEERNIRVRGFLFAASRESDNDFHLIVGRDPANDPIYMTMEVSGLPSRSNPSFDTLNGARLEYRTFFGSHLPGAGYNFYRPPIPVEIEGSLFFDITHADTGHPGPVDLRPNIPTIWEVHAVTSIVFEP
jgi:hypothetical protein